MEPIKSEPKLEYDQAINAVNVLDQMIGSYGAASNPSFYSPYAFHTFNHYYNQQSELVSWLHFSKERNKEF